MNFSTYNDRTLHSETVIAATKEKEATIHLLKHLTEVNKRKLFVEFGHSTLQKYIMLELGYSENESWTRIQAMRLISVSKNAEEKIKSGTLSLTNAALVQKHANETSVKTDSKEMDSLLNLASQTSHRHLKQELDKMKGEIVIEKKIILNERILKKMEKLCKAWGEKTEIEIIESLLDEKLLEISTQTSQARKTDESKNSRYIPVSVKKKVLQRAKHQCEHIHNGKRCTQRRNLQLDHIKPFALEGDRSAENIQMLCFAHNQRRAIKTFGLKIFNVKEKPR